MTLSLEDRRAPIDGVDLPDAGTLRAWGYSGPGRAPGHIHAGVDLPAAPGTPVLAPEAGEVVEVGALPMRPPWTGYAPAVLMLGASGRWHLLAHLSGSADGGASTHPAVRVGQRVQLGDVLGYVGRERHAHWEVRTRPHARRAIGETTYTITMDPSAWLGGRDVPVPRVPLLPADPQRGRHRQWVTSQVLAELG